MHAGLHGGFDVLLPIVHRHDPNGAAAFARGAAFRVSDESAAIVGDDHVRLWLGERRGVDAGHRHHEPGLLTQCRTRPMAISASGWETRTRSDGGVSMSFRQRAGFWSIRKCRQRYPDVVG